MIKKHKLCKMEAKMNSEETVAQAQVIEKTATVKEAEAATDSSNVEMAT